MIIELLSSSRGGPDFGSKLCKYIKAVFQYLHIICRDQKLIHSIICRCVSVLAGAKLSPNAFQVLDNVMIGIPLQ